MSDAVKDLLNSKLFSNDSDEDDAPLTTLRSKRTSVASNAARSSISNHYIASSIPFMNESTTSEFYGIGRPSSSNLLSTNNNYSSSINKNNDSDDDDDAPLNVIQQKSASMRSSIASMSSNFESSAMNISQYIRQQQQQQIQVSDMDNKSATRDSQVSLTSAFTASCVSIAAPQRQASLLSIPVIQETDDDGSRETDDVSLSIIRKSSLPASSSRRRSRSLNAAASLSNQSLGFSPATTTPQSPQNQPFPTNIFPPPQQHPSEASNQPPQMSTAMDTLSQLAIASLNSLDGASKSVAITAAYLILSRLEPWMDETSQTLKSIQTELKTNHDVSNESNPLQKSNDVLKSETSDTQASVNTLSSNFQTDLDALQSAKSNASYSNGIPQQMATTVMFAEAIATVAASTMPESWNPALIQKLGVAPKVGIVKARVQEFSQASGVEAGKLFDPNQFSLGSNGHAPIEQLQAGKYTFARPGTLLNDRPTLLKNESQKRAKDGRGGPLISIEAAKRKDNELAKVSNSLAYKKMLEAQNERATAVMREQESREKGRKLVNAANVTEVIAKRVTCLKCDGHGWSHPKDGKKKHDRQSNVQCKGCRTCSSCNGTGILQDITTCLDCQSLGYIHPNDPYACRTTPRCHDCVTCKSCHGSGNVHKVPGTPTFSLASLTGSSMSMKGKGGNGNSNSGSKIDVQNAVVISSPIMARLRSEKNSAANSPAASAGPSRAASTELAVITHVVKFPSAGLGGNDDSAGGSHPKISKEVDPAEELEQTVSLDMLQLTACQVEHQLTPEQTGGSSEEEMDPSDSSFTMPMPEDPFKDDSNEQINSSETLPDDNIKENDLIVEDIRSSEAAQ
ncbi:hypothetical protein BJ741DRAFT_617033 [Chytriomyces cf. hyalinus JEL632]|nr:hypothetical protein BJ741DRAFT_617033 [Chytriomyces cf. hyalinus JEL632]